jgi:hypothetical protein
MENTVRPLPPEPGTIADPSHGIQGDFSDLPDDGEEFFPEVNEDEDEEDDD